MLSLLTLAAAASIAVPPIQARLVSFENQRGGDLDGVVAHRLNVELTSAEGGQVDICPESLAVSTDRAVDGRFEPIRTFKSHAMRVGSDYKTGCGSVTLSPDRPQIVSFFIDGAVGGREVDRYLTTLDAGGSRFILAAQPGRRR